MPNVEKFLSEDDLVGSSSPTNEQLDKIAKAFSPMKLDGIASSEKQFSADGFKR